MRICLLPSDMDAPGSYRLLFPGRQLAEKGGHKVMLPPYRPKEMPDGRRRYQFDVNLAPPEPHADLWVLQQRLERLWPEKGVQRLRESGIATIAEVDDNYLELPSYNPAFKGTHPYVRDDGVVLNRQERRRIKSKTGWQRTPPNASNRDHMHAMFQRVDAMTVSTPYLADLYRPFNDRIHVLRNCLDWDMWEDITPQYEVKRERLRIGYLGVFRYRQGDLEVIRDVIEPFMLKHPEVDFVANTDAVHDFLRVPAGQRITIGEYDFLPRGDSTHALPGMTAVLDIGLVPLASNGLNEAKSHLKGMEYNAAGIPFIASNTESYRFWTAEGQNGLIVRDPKDWMSYLEYLVAMDDERRQMGEAGRRMASRQTVQELWPEWQDVYEQVLGDEFTAYARGAIARGAVQKVSELSNLLREIGSRPKPKVVVEIGSARGGTFWALCQVAHPDALMISIDVPAGSVIDRHPITGEDIYGGLDRQRFKTFPREGQQLALIDMDSHQQATLATLKHTLQGRPIDVLFIDGDHTYQGVKMDYDMYSPLVREGGIIAFHDTLPQNDPRSQVRKLWTQLERKARWAREWVGSDNWSPEMGRWGGIGAVEHA